MPVEVDNIEKLRSKRKVAKSAITRNINRVRELINNKESVSKVRQYAKNIEEAREKARTVIDELEKVDPSSIEIDGEWLVEVECDVTEALGEVADYLIESSQTEPQSPSINNEEQSSQGASENPTGGTEHSHSSGLTGVKIPVFDGSPDKWPYFWGIFSSLVDCNKSLTDAIKLAHLNNSVNTKVREVIACLTGEPGDYQKAVKLLSDRYGDPSEVVDAHLHRITNWQNIKEKDREGFERFADALQAAVFALDKPDYKHELRSMPLCTQLVRKLPPSERDEWVRQVEREQATENVKGLAEWAQLRVKTLRKRDRYNAPAQHKEDPKFNSKFANRRAFLAKAQAGKCALCDSAEKHKEGDCPVFLAADVNQRWDLVKSKGVCFGCLQRGHQRRQCSVSSKCGVNSCEKGHHKLLHATPTPPSAGQTTEQKGVHCGKAQVNASSPSKVALKTVVVPFVSDAGEIVMGTVLLDSGSETTLIRTGFAKQLGVQGQRQNLTVDAVGGVRTTLKSQRVRLPFAPSVTNADAYAWTIKNICEPVQSVNWTEIKKQYKHLYDVPVESVGEMTVDVLLGLDAASLMAPLEVRHGEYGEPYAELTPLGWVIAGPVPTTGNSGKRILRVRVVEEEEEDANHQLRRFWEIDSFGVRVETTTMYTHSEQRAIDSMNETCRQVESGYELGLLWKTDRPSLPNNFDTALSRLESVERRLQRDPKLADGYCKAINAYVEKGFARKLLPKEHVMNGEQWLLPHHPVISPHKPLPRVVFDSAAKHNGVCLNDCLEAGPSLHNDLPGILLRFRERPIALVGDVSDMFCHVRVKEEDRKYHRYLWRDLDSTRPPDVYEMNCLVFGDKSSPCEANFAVVRTTEDNKDQWPEAAAAVKRDIFVDDFYTSCNDVPQAVTMRADVTSLMAKGGFPMRKWLSSSPEVLATIPEAERSISNENLQRGDLPSGRALGIRWDAQSDTLGLTYAHIERPSTQSTKRGILAKLAGLYDPLGWSSPFTVRAKIIMQRTWSRGLDWDTPLPADIATEWAKWESEMAALKSFTVPRYIYSLSSKTLTRELVVFCDASEDACAAVAYMRAVLVDGEVICHLLMAKTRLMPLKTISIPRGELMGCQLAVRLAKTICEQLDLSMRHVTYLSDSTTAIWWIHGELQNFRPFVANRVAEVISESDPVQWHHVRTHLNIADIATRGAAAHDLQPESQWIKGPDFLKSDKAEWPVDDIPCSAPPTGMEMKKKVLRAEVLVPKLLDPAAYSNWLKLVRVTAWIIRFCHNLRKKDRRNTEVLSVEELKEAELYWVKFAQRDRFGAEIESLSKGRPVARASRIASLDPQLVNGVLHVGGRIDKAEMPWEAKHPIILDHAHDITRLIVIHYHRKLIHAGVEHVFNHIRERYWILRGRAEVKNCTVRCPLCHRRRVRPLTQKMSELPSTRLTGVSVPFQHVGLDYAGPFSVRIGRNRIEKRYICLFTCLHMRAVHLEVAHSLEADSFIMALRRFQARRGNPARILSDNGTNFIGAERELREALREIDQKRVGDELSSRGVQWIFNPPAAPWFGGAWESLVKSTKRAMKVIMGNVVTVDEVFLTVVAEVESLLNSRPLVYGGSSTSATDLSVLTPNHFLHGRASANLTPGEFVQRDMSLRRRWRHSQFLADQFWRRWKKEYVPHLIERSKWHTIQRNLRRGDLVLIVEENVPRGQWRLGRVVAPIASADGLVRSAEIVTQTGTYVRPVGKLALLEAHNEEE